MEKITGFIRRALGLYKNTPYQTHYMNETNIRTSMYITFVVMILEFWMMCRYVTERPGLGFWRYFDGEENYIILFLAATVLFAYSTQYIWESRKYRFVMYISLASAVIDVILMTRIAVFEFALKGPVKVLFDIKYSIALLILCVSVFIYEILYVKAGKRSSLFGQYVNSIFSLICLGFGMEVSLYDVSRHRQILCFVTMVIFMACLLIWKPYITIIILGAAFLYFYSLWAPKLHQLDMTFGGIVIEGDQINYFIYWLILSITSISIYQQRFHGATKNEDLIKVNEKLNRIAVEDELTGIYNMYHFVDECERILSREDVDPEKKIYLFLNIGNFRAYNERYGYQEGNRFLSGMAGYIRDVFKGDPCARQSDDHFVVFTDSDGVMEKINAINKEIGNRILPDQENTDSAGIASADRESAYEDIYLDMKVGACRPKGREEDPRIPLDRARYACALIRKNYDRSYLEYDENIDADSKMRQYIVNTIDTAIRKGYIHAYYQPVVDAVTHELKGVEALARWIDPTYGFISPGLFVPVLEEYRQIHKLDRCIYETVCRDLRDATDRGLKVVPVSLNFSRLDFELMDAVSYLENLLGKYNIRKDQIHVEITESALNDTDVAFKAAIRSFKEEGFEVWLDDFGSGYSSLNVLKDYDFDVLKVDMQFLKGIESNDNARIILSRIIEMAKDIGMTVLSEGVESAEIAEFLRDRGCRLLQGYHFGKPMPRVEIRQKIASGELVLND